LEKDKWQAAEIPFGYTSILTHLLSQKDENTEEENVNMVEKELQ